MSEVIPISKTPSQEKAAFLPPKLDWNENGNLNMKNTNFYSNLHFIFSAKIQ